jgi:HEAT repeat protein
MLVDPSPRVVYGSLEVLWMTEPEPTSAIPKIMPFLNDANTRVRIEASYVLGSLAPIPASLLEPLVKALTDADGAVRANAVRAIGLSGASSEEVSSALAGLLQDSNAVTRFRAAEALVRLYGPDALCQEPLVSQVIREAELSSNDYFNLIGFNARTALGKEEMSHPATVKMFSRLLCHPSAYMRSDALAGLMFRLERSASRIPTEIETLLRAAEHDHNSFVRLQARSILDRWGEPE